MFKRACIAFGLLQFSPKPLGWLMWRCAAAVAVSTAHYRSISSLQPSCSLPLSHRHHHLATVRMAVERTFNLELATPLALTPSTLSYWLSSASPPLGNYSARFSLLAVIQRVSGRAFVGDGTRFACRLSPVFPHCVPILAARVVGGVASFRMCHCSSKVCEWTITNFERHFFFYTAKLRLGSICKVRRCFSRNLHPYG